MTHPIRPSESTHTLIVMAAACIVAAIASAAASAAPTSAGDTLVFAYSMAITMRRADKSNTMWTTSMQIASRHRSAPAFPPWDCRTLQSIQRRQLACATLSPITINRSNTNSLRLFRLRIPA